MATKYIGGIGANAGNDWLVGTSSAANDTQGSDYRVWDTNVKGSWFIAEENGEASSAFFDISLPDSLSHRALLYEFDGGNIGTLLASSAVSTSTRAYGWHEFTFSAPADIVAGRGYLIALAVDGGGGDNVISFDIGDAENRAFDFSTVGGSVASPPASVEFDGFLLGPTTRSHGAYLVYEDTGAGSNTNLTVEKADLQPSSSAVAFAAAVAIGSASLQPSPSVVALDWQQDTLTIGVDAAAITLAPSNVDGRRAVTVTRAVPTIAGQDIQFQLSSGTWTMPVTSGAPPLSGQNVVLEKNNFFERAAPLFSPSSVVLSENAVVVSAAPSIAGQEITLTWGQGIIGVQTATFSVQGQDVVLSKSWSLAVDHTSLDIDGQNIVFDWVVPSTVVVEPALLSFSPSNVSFRNNIMVASTAIAPDGQELTRGDGIIVEQMVFAITPRNIDFIYDYPFGYAFDAATFSVSGQDIPLYVGSGAPTRFRSSLLKDRIEISFSKPPVYRKHLSGRIRG